ncbi:MAG: acetyl-CoA carboxylase biotin carboxyl carrier protein [Chthonomonadales bacterium]
MAEFGFDLNEVAALVSLMEEHGLQCVEVAEPGRRIVVTGTWAGSVPARASLAAPATASVAPRDEPAEPSTSGRRVAIVSPMVGVFYRASSPGSPPLVEVGDRVEVGQPVGIIEAMKVFSEIPSEHAGIVVEIVARDGTLVRTGEPLMYLRPED